MFLSPPSRSSDAVGKPYEAARDQTSDPRTLLSYATFREALGERAGGSKGHGNDM